MKELEFSPRKLFWRETFRCWCQWMTYTFWSIPFGIILSVLHLHYGLTAHSSDIMCVAMAVMVGVPTFFLAGKWFDKRWPMPKHKCPVCYYPYLRKPPEDHLICPSCGTQFGYSDSSSTKTLEQMHKILRTKWENRGCVWDSTVVRKPNDWNPDKP